MNDMRATIVPKSDQLNADDLIGTTRTIRVTKVLLSATADQPVAIHFEGDDGKPYMPCKSMRRVLVNVWGPDANVYAGRRMTLYRDDKVQFGGMAVGGIRISHLSDIDRDVTMALTTTRANRKPFTVKPLARADREPTTTTREASGEATQPGGAGGLTLAQRTDAYLGRLGEAKTTLKMKALRGASEALRGELDRSDPEKLIAVEEAFNAKYAELDEAEREMVR